MKIGILTYHRAINYGAYLQACALCNRLNQEDDIDAEIIDFRMRIEEKSYNVSCYSWKKKAKLILSGTYRFYLNREAAFNRAMNNPLMKKSESSLVSDSLEEFRKYYKGKYDVIIAGSDEIWKVNNMRGFPNAYWLLGDMGCRKFSYAASSRVEFKKCLSSDDYSVLEKALSDFELIGVRDDLTYREVRGAVNNNAPVMMCCDPSFLYDFKVSTQHILKKIQTTNKLNVNLKNVLVMLDDRESADIVRKNCKGKYNLISVCNSYKGFINIPNLEPMEWLCLIDEVDFVLSSFFHAACFSIIRKKPFLALLTERKASKVEELLHNYGLQERGIRLGNKRVDIDSLIGEFMHSVDCSDIIDKNRENFKVFLDYMRMDTSKENEMK